MQLEARRLLGGLGWESIFGQTKHHVHSTLPQRTKAVLVNQGKSAWESRCQQRGREAQEVTWGLPSSKGIQGDFFPLMQGSRLSASSQDVEVHQYESTGTTVYLVPLCRIFQLPLAQAKQDLDGPHHPRHEHSYVPLCCAASPWLRVRSPCQRARSKASQAWGKVTPDTALSSL